MSTQNANRVSIKSVLLAAIGGQGGNVLVEWLFLAAERDGRKAQALSLPGLSQRGGGTNFYLEIASLENPTNDASAQAAALEQTVFAQFPFPGQVDVLIGQELIELGRLLQGGYATHRTTVVSSNQRVYTIDEKMPAFDGVFPSEKIVEAAARLAGSLAIIDTAELARRQGLGELATNAILLGALSAIPGALPMPAERYREAIREFGLVPEMNLKAFEVGREYQLQDLRLTVEDLRSKNPELNLSFNQLNNENLGLADTGPARIEGAADSGEPAPKKARRQISLTPIQKDKGGQKAKTLDPAALTEARAAALNPHLQKGFRQMAGEITAEWPVSLQSTLIEAVFQLTDYQSVEYAGRYIKLVKSIFELEPPGESAFKLTQTYAKTLAMRMTYEDAIRVATLKIKPGRLERIRRDMDVKPGQVLHVTDYLKPDAAEIYGIMPYFLVEPMLWLGKISGIGYWLGRQHFTWQQHPKVTTLGGHMTFRFLTWFKPLRLSSHRFHHEWKLIQNYNELVRSYARQDYALGLLVAESGRLVKGYGDTRRKMIKATERLYANILRPLAQWEAANQTKTETLPLFAVTHQTGQTAIQLIGRSDAGLEQVEALATKILKAAKDDRLGRLQLLRQLN